LVLQPHQELVGGGVKGVRPDWLGKRKKLQIHWTRRGWSHGLGSRHGGVEARRSRGSSHESMGGRAVEVGGADLQMEGLAQVIGCGGAE